MGWSCSKEASKTMDSWMAGCRQQTGSSNAFISGGKQYFFEHSSIEHHDGAITGSIVMLTTGRKVGAFRIAGDGLITLAPSKLRIFTDQYRDKPELSKLAYGRVT